MRLPQWLIFSKKPTESGSISQPTGVRGRGDDHWSSLPVVVLDTWLIPGDIKYGIQGWDLDTDSSLGYPGWDPKIHARTNFHMTKKYLVELAGELCLVMRYVIGSSTAYFKVFCIDFSAKELKRRIWPFENDCLFLGNNYSFTWKAGSPPLEAFKHFQDPPDEGTYVFYTYDDDWRSYICHEEPPHPDVGVWEMLGDEDIYISRDPLTRYPPLWIIPPISFRRIED